MKNKSFITKALLISAVTAGIATFAAGSSQAAESSGKEKCYGIAKAGKNDCASGKVSCAGTASSDNQGDAFLVVPKGLCDKISGGSTAPKK